VSFDGVALAVLIGDRSHPSRLRGQPGAKGQALVILAHAQCPVVAIPPPALAGELGHGRLAWAFWRRSLTPEQVLRDHDRPAA
jgi:hypothetical protein